MDRTTFFGLVVVGIVLLLLGGVLILLMVTFWLPVFRNPDPPPVDYFTPCDANLAAQDCRPARVYAEHCGPGIRESRCDQFCAALSHGDARFCEYIDSCGGVRAADFTAVCSTQNCSPETLGSCPGSTMRQFCLGGLSSDAACGAYCISNYLCSWKDSGYRPPESDVCLPLDLCALPCSSPETCGLVLE